MKKPYHLPKLPFKRIKEKEIENTLTYTGRELDRSTKLYYYRARYYDPRIGRFITGDPLLREFARSYASICGTCGGLGRGSLPEASPLAPSPSIRWLHPYVYVKNNPVNFVDPEGLRISRGELYWLMWGGVEQIKKSVIVNFREAEKESPELWPIARSGRIMQALANKILGEIFCYSMANQIPLPKWMENVKDLVQKIYQLLNSVTKRRVEYAKVEVPSWKATILIAWDRCGEVRMPVLWYSEEGEEPWGYKAFVVDFWSKTPRDISNKWPEKYEVRTLYYYPPEAARGR